MLWANDLKSGEMEIAQERVPDAGRPHTISCMLSPKNVFLCYNLKFCDAGHFLSRKDNSHDKKY